MMELTPDECRVLGTLIEKAMTTPAQYPLSLNSLVTGVNQKSNRDPVVEIDETRALEALDGLRRKGLVRDVSFTGARVEKFRHTAGEALAARGPELAVLAELLLRGPQTSGELRGRASRMAAFDSIDAVEGTLASMAAEDRAGGEAGGAGRLVRCVSPAPGSRASRWAQCLCEDLHAIASSAFTSSVSASSSERHVREGLSETSAVASTSASASARIEALEARVAELERRLARVELRDQPSP